MSICGDPSPPASRGLRRVAELIEMRVKYLILLAFKFRNPYYANRVCVGTPAQNTSQRESAAMDQPAPVGANSESRGATGDFDRALGFTPFDGAGRRGRRTGQANRLWTRQARSLHAERAVSAARRHCDRTPKLGTNRNDGRAAVSICGFAARKVCSRVNASISPGCRTVMSNTNTRQSAAGSAAPSPPSEKQDAQAATCSTPATKDGAVAFAVVGLGASAGGLEALARFLDATPYDSGLAFVVIHHADPHHESSIAELLSTHTAIPVTFALDGEPIEPNHVYVIPPNSFLTLDDGVLRLTPPDAGHGVRLPIDVFLCSLADAQRERAIAIILSGAGSDGALGVKAVKESGGMAMAQVPSEAEHDVMPRYAIATNLVDHVLPVAEMPRRLVEYSRNPRASSVLTKSQPPDSV